MKTDFNDIAHTVLRTVRSDARYLADETGECFQELLTEQLSKLLDYYSEEVVEQVTVHINTRLARSCGLI